MEDKEILFYSLINIAEDLINLVEGESCKNYYSKSLGKTVEIKHVKEVWEEAKNYKDE